MITSKVHGGQNGCEECRLDPERPDEESPTCPDQPDRDLLRRCWEKRMLLAILFVGFSLAFPLPSFAEFDPGDVGNPNPPTVTGTGTRFTPRSGQPVPQSSGGGSR